MMHRAPGRAHREGITVVQLMDMFRPKRLRPFGSRMRSGTASGAAATAGASEQAKSLTASRCPTGATDCRSYFSIRTATPIAHSKIALRKWVIAIYLCLTSLKGVSSMKLHRDIGVSQAAAWFMLHRIRQAWGSNGGARFGGPVEVDESYFGGKARNMHAHKRKQVIKGRGPAGKTIVIGAKDRQTNRVSARSSKIPTSRRFKASSRRMSRLAQKSTPTSTPAMTAYRITRRSATASKSTSTAWRTRNGIESFWATLKRAHKGVFHKISPKHLDKYIQEFASKHNIRDLGTLDQMLDTVASMVGHGCSTGISLRTTVLALGLGRSSARAKLSGVAPFRSRSAIIIGFLIVLYSSCEFVSIGSSGPVQAAYGRWHLRPRDSSVC